MEHGTVTGYRNHGCRCADCRKAHAEANRRNREDRLASGRLNHGTRSALDAGCRCVACKATKATHLGDYSEMGLTRSDVAALLGIGVRTVTWREKAGKLTAVRTPGGHRRYPPAQFSGTLRARAAREGKRS